MSTPKAVSQRRNGAIGLRLQAGEHDAVLAHLRVRAKFKGLRGG